MDLLSCEEAEVRSIVSVLPKGQQVVVLYVRERLEMGILPFSEHDCALCACETADQMSRFLNENGLPQVTTNLIRHIGVFGRGALLFLSAKDIQLEEKDRRALTLSRQAHRKSKN